MTVLPLSLIVLTKNEARTIAACLDSVPFAAEKVVIDANSTDATCSVAEDHGARVVTMDWKGFGEQRRAAEEFARHEWILMLDADERFCEPKSACTIIESLLPNSVAVSLQRETWYMGARMRYYRPFAADSIVRLYKKGCAAWTAVPVHESLRVDGDVTPTHIQIEHHSYASITEHLRKAATYIDLWANAAHERGTPSRLWLMPIMFPIFCFRDFLLRRGICDGWRGCCAAGITVMSSLLKRFRLYEKRRSHS